MCALSRTLGKVVPRSKATPRRAKLLLEMLEPRTMFSAQSPFDALVATPNINFLASTGYAVYSPAQIRHAYGFDKVNFTGAGQTIAIVDAYDDPTVVADLHKFDQQWGLADPKLTVAKMTSNGVGPKADSGWAMEIALDVEWAHAIAPGANILLVEAVNSSLSSLLGAVDYVRNQAGVSVVSMSWGAGEFSSEGYYDSYFTTPKGHAGVTFVASSGDSGAPSSWPSISGNVLAVGGTTLTLTSGNYGSEAGWSGSGGGYSPYLSEPGYQRGFQNTGHRSNPDVGYDADPRSGFYVNQGGSWYAVGGTSAGAPQWAGLIAIANQGRAQAGLGTLGSSLLPAMYSLSNADFHDVTTGSNGYRAGVGYDAVTGRGSPIANLVVRDLVSYGAPTSTRGAEVVVPVTTSPTGGLMHKAAEVVNAGATAPQASRAAQAESVQFAAAVGGYRGAVAPDATTSVGAWLGELSTAGVAAARTFADQGEASDGEQTTPAALNNAVEYGAAQADASTGEAAAATEVNRADTAFDAANFLGDRSEPTGDAGVLAGARVDAVFADTTTIRGDSDSAAIEAVAAGARSVRLAAPADRSNAKVSPLAAAAMCLAFNASSAASRTREVANQAVACGNRIDPPIGRGRILEKPGTSLPGFFMRSTKLTAMTNSLGNHPLGEFG